MNQNTSKHLARIFILLLTISTSLSANEGHRLGGDLFGGDNSLETFGKLLAEYGDSEKFDYAEYDIRESADGQLVSYHDATLRGKEIKKLTLAEIRELKPDVPTVAEIYAFAAKSGQLKNKALVGDIKSIQSDQARAELLQLAESYKEEIETWFMGKPDDIRGSFSDFHRWAVMFGRAQIPMYIPLMPKISLNNQFAYLHRTELHFNYKTLIEKPVSFTEENNRTQFFNIDTPADTKHTCLRLGVKHGYDDKGDGASRIRVISNATNKVLCDMKPSLKGWQWTVLSDIPEGGVKIEWSDLDTPLKGGYPGNATLVNVTLGVYSPLGKSKSKQ